MPKLSILVTDWAVVPRMSDGLGNRLFQYAVALGLAKKWNRPVRFSRAYMVASNHGDPEDFLKLFPDVPVDDVTDPVILTQAGADLFVYREFPEAPPGNVVLIDSRQNPAYFAKVVVEPVWPSIPVPDLSGSWMIHFRRGDYDILSHYFVDLTRYYRRCLLAVPEGSSLRVFSDEPGKCKDFLESVMDGREYRVSWSTETVDYKALHEMSLCTGGAITANSTFSWWGAYFAKARAGPRFQAFYPKSWGPGLPEATGVVPPWGEYVDTI